MLRPSGNRHITSLTYCWSQDKMWCLKGKNVVSLTFCWDMNYIMRLRCKEKMPCNSPTVSQGMRHYEHDCLVKNKFYSPPGDHWMKRPGKRKNVVSLTYCSSCDETWWESLAIDKYNATHPLLVMGWEMMRLLGKKIMQCHSPTVCHGMRHGKFTSQRKKVQCPLPPVNHELRLPSTRKMECHSLPVDHDETC